MNRKKRFNTIIIAGIGLIIVFGLIIFLVTQNLGGDTARAAADLPIIVGSDYDFENNDPDIGDEITITVSTILPENTQGALALKVPIKYEWEVLSFTNTSDLQPGEGFISLNPDDQFIVDDPSFDSASGEGDYRWVSIDVSRQNAFDQPYGGELVLATFNGVVMEDRDTTVEFYLPEVELSSNQTIELETSTFEYFLDIQQEDNNVGEITDDSEGSSSSGTDTTGETGSGETTTGETGSGETGSGETTTGETGSGETTGGDIEGEGSTSGSSSGDSTGETTTGETGSGETTTGETTGGDIEGEGSTSGSTSGDSTGVINNTDNTDTTSSTGSSSALISGGETEDVLADGELPRTDYIPALGLDPFDIRTWPQIVLWLALGVIFLSTVFVASIIFRNL